MHQSYPVPPPELVQQWRATPEYTDLSEKIFVVSLTTKKLQDIATQAAQWGADQELEATLGLMATLNIRGVDYVRNARRSARAPTLKEQALEALEHILHNSSTELGAETIRRALEALNG